jgi:small subunit ribosomal protein S31
MGIFQVSQSEDTTCETLKTWQAISNREMGILTTQSPRNLIEDMASMTEKGILWHFPINNEQGIDEDQVGILRYIFFRNQVDFISLMTIFSSKVNIIFETKNF